MPQLTKKYEHELLKAKRKNKWLRKKAYNYMLEELTSMMNIKNEGRIPMRDVQEYKRKLVQRILRKLSYKSKVYRFTIASSEWGYNRYCESLEKSMGKENFNEAKEYILPEYIPGELRYIYVKAYEPQQAMIIVRNIFVKHQTPIITLHDFLTIDDKPWFLIKTGGEEIYDYDKELQTNPYSINVINDLYLMLTRQQNEFIKKDHSWERIKKNVNTDYRAAVPGNYRFIIKKNKKKAKKTLQKLYDKYNYTTKPPAKWKVLQINQTKFDKLSKDKKVCVESKEGEMRRVWLVKDFYREDSEYILNKWKIISKKRYKEFLAHEYKRINGYICKESDVRRVKNVKDRAKHQQSPWKTKSPLRRRRLRINNEKRLTLHPWTK